MSDQLGEALAQIGPLIEPIDGVPYGVTISADSPIVAAARNWHALTPLIQDGVEGITDLVRHASKWGYDLGDAGWALVDALAVTADEEATP